MNIKTPFDIVLAFDDPAWSMTRELLPSVTGVIIIGNIVHTQLLENVNG